VLQIMHRLAALSSEIERAKQALGEGTGIAALSRLKAEREGLVRAFGAPDFWTQIEA
jgi:DNA primase